MESQTNSSQEIDLFKLALALLHNKVFIIIASLVFGVIAYIVSAFFITPLYESTSSLYVNNYNAQKTGMISSSDVSASKSLVETYIKILSSNSIKSLVLEKSGIQMDIESLKEMVKASSDGNTEILKIVVTHEDPQVATAIANAYAEVAFEYIPGIVDGSSVKIIDYAIESDKPSSPNTFRNVILAVLLGFIFSCMIVVVREIMDNRVKALEDLPNADQIPVLGIIPNYEQAMRNLKSSYERTDKEEA